jgi:two-component system, OmpR family, alkaline phosphatase synthesis response regulator PhoP
MKKKILIIDDEPEILLVSSSRLRASGYTVITAHNGEDALARARSEVPDMIIVDVMMPPPDGYSVCKTLKADTLLKTKPVLLCTAEKKDEAHTKSLQCGADGYIRKPFNSAELLATIKKHIG